MTLTEQMKTTLTILLAEVRRVEAVPDECPAGMDPGPWSALRRDRTEYDRCGIRHDLAGWLGHAPTPAESAVFSRTLRNMEAMGLLVRVSRWGGRRATHVRLTPAGRAEAEHVAQEHEAALAKLMAGVGWHLEGSAGAAKETANMPESGLDSSAPAR